jgi:Asp/Glu/hydantoin racemase
VTVPQSVALIHTSQVFLHVEPVFNPLLAEILPGVRVINIVDDSLLPDCFSCGCVPSDVIRRFCAYSQCAETAGAAAILSVCSSLGPAVDVARKLVRIPIVKVDDAHTEAAVRQAASIGVLATASTTLAPTVALVREKAAALGKPVRVTECLAGDAFHALQRGERQLHDQLLLAAAQSVAPQVDLILFAQGSMTRLAPAVEQATGRPVFTSPRPAVELLKRVLAG